VIEVKIGFKDDWDRQLLAVRGFLDRNDVTSGDLTMNFHRQSISAWQFRITNVARVLEMSRRMLPYVFKKRTELKGGVLDYLEDRITGDELIALVNNEVAIGSKTGKIKQSTHLPMKSGGDPKIRLFLRKSSQSETNKNPRGRLSSQAPKTEFF
jgi:hypothetical protein